MTDPDLAPKLAYLREIGFAGVEHDSHVPFLSHLAGTRRLLREWGCRSALCDAGLFHSVYGTEYFDPAELATAERSDVAALIGEEAERVAWLWCTIVRDEIDLETLTAPSRITGEPILVTAAELGDLATLWAADAVEQIERMTPDERGFARTLPRLLPFAAPVAQEAMAPLLLLVDER